MPNKIAPSRTSDAAAAGMRLLLVEDEGLVALEMEWILTTAGHSVIGIAVDHASVTALLDQPGQRPDLALVDIRLANGSSGLQVAQDLAAIGVPVLFVTGNCPPERPAVSAVGCLHKPFTETELINSVAAADAMRRGIPPAGIPLGLCLY